MLAMKAPTDALRLWRIANGLTQAELGEKFNVNDSAINKWERKRVPAERVLDVSDLTGLPPHRIRPDLYRAPDMQGAA